MEIAIDRLNRETMDLEPIARIVDGVITEGETHLEGIPFTDGDLEPDAILERFTGPTLFARPVEGDAAGEWRQAVDDSIEEDGLPASDREVHRTIQRGTFSDGETVARQLSKVWSENVLVAAYAVDGDDDQYQPIRQAAKAELLSRGYHPEMHLADSDLKKAVGEMPDDRLKEYVSSGALLRFAKSETPPEITIGDRVYSRDECLELLGDAEAESRTTAKAVLDETDHRPPVPVTKADLALTRALDGKSPSALPESDDVVVKAATGENQRTTMRIDVDTLPVPPASRLSKADFEYEAVDDALFGAIRKQVWADDIEKAPMMWEDSSNVPRYVKQFIDAAIEDENALYHEFSGVHDSAVAQLHGVIENQLLGPEGWSIRTVSNAIYGSFGEVSKDQAENIARTEIAAVLNTARMLALDNSDHDVEFAWVGPDDHATTQLCSEVKEELDRQGGHMPLAELKELLRRKAHKFADTYGTPGRVESLIPHYRCRHTLVRADMAHLYT